MAAALPIVQRCASSSINQYNQIIGNGANTTRFCLLNDDDRFFIAINIINDSNNNLVDKAVIFFQEWLGLIVEIKSNNSDRLFINVNSVASRLHYTYDEVAQIAKKQNVIELLKAKANEVKTLIDGSSFSLETGVTDLAYRTFIHCANRIKFFISQNFYENSILLALSNQEIAKRQEEYQDYTWQQRFSLGVCHGFNYVVAGNILMMGYMAITGEPFTGKRRYDFITSVIISSIFEEMIVRGIMQNGLAATQHLINAFVPELHDNHLFKWIVSPSARIIAINYFVSSNNDVFNAGKILLMPDHSILHETTGDIVASIGSRMVYNLSSYFLCNL